MRRQRFLNKQRERTCCGVIVLLLILLGLQVTVTARQTNIEGERLVPDPPSDSLLQMEQYAPHPEADYVYALDKAEVRFEQEEGSIVAVIDYFVRIKILNEEGKRAALVDIPYYFDQKVEEVSRIEGATYHPDGSRVGLRSSDIRTINLNARYNVKEFRMPSVKEGSVIQYRYTMRRQYIEELPDFYFAHQVPTIRSTITIHNPRYIRYDAEPLQVRNRLKYSSHTVDTSSVPQIFTIPQPSPILVESWTARNVDPVKPRPFLPSVDDYRGRIKFQISEFGIPRQPLENSWELVAAKIRRSRSPLKVLEQSSAFVDSLAAGITRRIDTRKAVQDSIFRLVNQRMRYNDNTSIYSDKTPRAVLAGEIVDQAAVNQALLKLLRAAGIKKSWPVLISTRDHGFVNRSFPSPFQFNGLLIVTEIEGVRYFMDASFSHSRPGLIPVSMNSRSGMVLKRNSHEWIEISPSHSLNDIQITVKGRLNRQGDLSIRMNGSTSGYPGRVIRKKINEGEDPEKVIHDSFLQGYDKIEVDTVNIANVEQYQQPLELMAEVEIKQYGQSFKSGVKYNPMILGYLMENPFETKDRDLPVVLDAPEYLDFTYKIRLPKNSAVESTRTDRNIGIPNGSLDEYYRLGGKLLQYRYEIRMFDSYYPAETYPQLRSLYQRWVELSRQDWFLKVEQTN